MIYRGTVQNGVVILPQNVHLPDGQSVSVQPIGQPVDWPDGYFEQTAGALAGEEFERAEQGELPDREVW